MTTVAYDLDGVFVPDCDVIPFLGGLEEFYRLTLFMKPIFIPSGEYLIITARQLRYKYLTEVWIDKYMSNRPRKLFHEIDHSSAEVYKAKVINENNIDTYIESDLGIVNYLKVHTEAQIIHFSELIKFTVSAN